MVLRKCHWERGPQMSPKSASAKAEDACFDWQMSAGQGRCRTSCKPRRKVYITGRLRAFRERGGCFKKRTFRERSDPV